MSHILAVYRQVRGTAKTPLPLNVSWDVIEALQDCMLTDYGLKRVTLHALILQKRLPFLPLTFFEDARCRLVQSCRLYEPCDVLGSSHSIFNGYLLFVGFNHRAPPSCYSLAVWW